MSQNLIRSQFTPPVLGGRMVERADLTGPQLALLRELDLRPAFRVKNGWRFRGGARVTLKTATRLLVLGLVWIQYNPHRLTTTVAGRAFLARNDRKSGDRNAKREARETAKQEKLAAAARERARSWL